MIITVQNGGTVYSLSDGSLCRFLGADGLGAPDLHRMTTRGPGQHGVTDRDYRLDPRTFTLTLELEGDNLEDLYLKRENLLTALSPTQSGSPLKFGFNFGKARYIDAYFVGEGKMGYKDKEGFTQKASFVFYSPEGLFYQDVNQFLTINLGGGGASFVVPTPVPSSIGTSVANTNAVAKNGGNARTTPFPIRVFGPITSPVITNLGTGEKLDFTGHTIPDGHYWEVDARYGRQTVVDQAGTAQDHKLTADSDLGSFHLGPPPEVPNGDNVIQVTGTGINANSMVTMAWKPRNLGI
jgi:hypothetical protein